MLLIDLIEQLRKFAVSIDFIEYFSCTFKSSKFCLSNITANHNYKFCMGFLIISTKFRIDCLQSAGKSSVSMLITPAFLSFLIGILSIN